MSTSLWPAISDKRIALFHLFRGMLQKNPARGLISSALAHILSSLPAVRFADALLEGSSSAYMQGTSKTPKSSPSRFQLHSSLILRKIPRATSPRLGPFSWTAPGKILFQTKANIDVAVLSDRGLCDSPSVHQFHGEICELLEVQILHTTGVRHVISHLPHSANLVYNIPTCELFLSQF